MTVTIQPRIPSWTEGPSVTGFPWGHSSWLWFECRSREWLCNSWALSPGNKCRAGMCSDGILLISFRREMWLNSTKPSYLSVRNVLNKLHKVGCRAKHPHPLWPSSSLCTDVTFVFRSSLYKANNDNLTSFSYPEISTGCFSEVKVPWTPKIKVLRALRIYFVVVVGGYGSPTVIPANVVILVQSQPSDRKYMTKTDVCTCVVKCLWQV